MDGHFGAKAREISMHRFFVTQAQIAGGKATVTGEDVLHITRVLRLQPGEEADLCDGQGGEYRGRIEQMDGAAVVFGLSQRRDCDTEPRHRVTLYQCLPKAGKMETIIQKCVELGVCGVTPVVSARCVVKPDRDFEKKRQRYQRVAYEAAKQSRRGIIPEVKPLITLSDIDTSGHDLTLLAYEDETRTGLKAALADTTALDIAIIIGPEGGFAAEEADMLRAKGAVSVRLGPRILRTETAGMAMLAMLLFGLEG